jgi:uncharacterized protein YdhG (YjbR/CyaY superfamily)
VSPPASSVDAYLAEATEPWASTLARLRAACLESLAGYEEAIAYGMPSYLRGGQVEIAFKKQARYLSLYVLKQAVLDQFRSELDHLSVGKGCVRFTRPGQLDWKLIERLLEATAHDEAEPC